FHLVERPGHPLQPALLREQVELERGPVGEEDLLVARAAAGLQVAAAALAPVDAQARPRFDREHGELARVGPAERAGAAGGGPARRAAAADEEARAAVLLRDQERHRGRRAAGRAVAAMPTLLVAPAREGVDDRAQEAGEHVPAEEAQQSGRR